MTATPFRAVLLRELAGIRAQLEAYDTDQQIWSLPPNLPNSAGTLALHLAGNLSHFVGTVLGGTDYVRDRDAEFADRDLPRAELLRRLNQAGDTIAAVLGDGPADATDRSVEVAGVALPVPVVLGHLVAHLAYHLGQIDYHRRIVTGRGDGLGMVNPKALNL
jgi:hypothetical protein